MENILEKTVPNKKLTEAKKKEKIFLFLMLILPVVQWLIYFVYLNIDSILLAFQDKRTGAFTFQNFQLVWEQLVDPRGDINIAITNTMIYFGVDFLIILPLSLLMSYFFYKKILGYKVFRVIFYLPAIVSTMVMVEAFSSFVAPNGVVAQFLELFGYTIPPQGLFASSNTATKTIVVYCIWTGFCSKVLLFGGAMARIPVELLESARLDGCGPFRELIQMIFPLIWSTTSTQVVLLFTGLFNSSGPILLFTNGAYDTQTLNYWIFEQIYGGGRYGGSTGNYNIVSCTGLCFTLVGVPIILFIRWLMDRVPTVEY